MYTLACLCEFCKTNAFFICEWFCCRVCLFVFFNMWMLCYFTFLSFLLKIQGFMLLMNSVLTYVPDPCGSFTHIPFLHTFSACAFGNLNYLLQLLCSLDVRFLAQVTEVAQQFQQFKMNLH